MVSTALPAICCSSWAAWSMTAVKMVRGKGRSQGEGGVLSNVSFPLRHCGQQGPERDTEPWRLAWCCVWCYSEEWVQLLLVWNPRKCPCSFWCQHHIMWPTCIVSQTPTSCCLTSALIFPLNDISKRICLFSFFPIDVCYFSAERRCV